MNERQRGGRRRDSSPKFFVKCERRESSIYAVAQSQGCRESRHESWRAIAKMQQILSVGCITGVDSSLQVPRYPSATQLEGSSDCGSKGPPN